MWLAFRLGLLSFVVQGVACGVCCRPTKVLYVCTSRHTSSCTRPYLQHASTPTAMWRCLHWHTALWYEKVICQRAHTRTANDRAGGRTGPSRSLICVGTMCALITQLPTQHHPASQHLPARIGASLGRKRGAKSPLPPRLLSDERG